MEPDNGKSWRLGGLLEEEAEEFTLLGLHS